VESSLVLLFIVWLFFAASVVGGLVFGKVLAHGSAGGGRGMGHLADRRSDPITFTMMMVLYGFIALLLLVATDAFDQVPGLAEKVGFDQPIQENTG